MTGPCHGLAVVEVAGRTSELGLGLAAGVPGMLLADLGASVTRIVDPRPVEIDAGVEWGRVWHRAKRMVRTDDRHEILGYLTAADVAIVYGPETDIEQRGLGYAAAGGENPGLVYARCRPSRTAAGPLADYGLVVEAASGFCTQLGGHRPGPIFVDVKASGSGAAFIITASVLALLRQRALTGVGGWAETSLYDGLLATLGCMVGRSERAPAEIERYWEQGSWFPNFLYRCADGELVQIWFGGKGMYASLIDVLGDEPSREGYYADQAAGRLGERAARWRSVFATEKRSVWIERLRAAGVACEPVLGPGDALCEAHLVETGLAVPGAGPAETVVGCPISVRPLGPGPVPRPSPRGPAGPLDGIRVVDFSAFVAGPLAAEVLADLGASVVKVEPPQGEAMRGAAYAMAACQRGKRSLAIDITAPEARPAVEELLRSADVVLHNFRVGVAERIGIDQATVARLNPAAVYCHATAFGPTGPRAPNPGNDALMQALTGFERAAGGDGRDPVAATWIPIDMSGGWIAACAILAGLLARTRDGEGQSVATSLLGAGLLLQSGVFWRAGVLVRGPSLDGEQTGFGPGYRLYRAGDGGWLAVVIPDRDAWDRLRRLPGLQELPTVYTPVRNGPAGTTGPAERSEAVLAAALARRPAAEWAPLLNAAGAVAVIAAEAERDQFRRAILDDPLNHQLGRVVSYPTPEWGRLEQIGLLVRTGPAPAGRPALGLPGIGEHTVEILAETGLGPDAIEKLLAAGVASCGGGITAARAGAARS